MNSKDLDYLFEPFPLEKPVKKAVLTVFMSGEDTGSSGFHHYHPTPRWGIVFNGRASDLVVRAAIESGLEVELRQHSNLAPDEWLTDVTLPDVPESEPDRAKQVFDLFAKIYVRRSSVNLSQILD